MKPRKRWVISVVVILAVAVVLAAGALLVRHWQYTGTPEEHKARQLVAELRDKPPGTVKHWLIKWGLMKEKEPRDPDEIVKDLAVLGESAVPPLIEALKDEFWYVQWHAIMALGQIGPAAEKAVPGLIRVFREGDDNPNARVEAARALGNIGPAAKEAIPMLIETFEGPQIGAIEAAMTALEKIGPAAVPALIEGLKKDERATLDVSVFSAEVLGRIGPAAMPALTEALKDEGWCVRMHAAMALGRIGPAAEEAVPGLVRAFRDRDYSPEDISARIEAARALGNIGPAAREAVPSLTEALKDENTDVREAAAKALKRIHSKPGAER